MQGLALERSLYKHERRFKLFQMSFISWLWLLIGGNFQSCGSAPLRSFGGWPLDADSENLKKDWPVRIWWQGSLFTKALRGP